MAYVITEKCLGERYATEDDLEQRLTGYTVLDLGASYQWSFLELGIAVENLTNTDWSSSEFYYGSCTAQDDAAGRCNVGSGVGVEDRQTGAEEGRAIVSVEVIGHLVIIITALGIC